MLTYRSNDPNGDTFGRMLYPEADHMTDAQFVVYRQLLDDAREIVTDAEYRGDGLGDGFDAGEAAGTGHAASEVAFIRSDNASFAAVAPRITSTPSSPVYPVRLTIIFTTIRFFSVKR